VTNGHETNTAKANGIHISVHQVGSTTKTRSSSWQQINGTCPLLCTVYHKWFFNHIKTCVRIPTHTCIHTCICMHTLTHSCTNTVCRTAFTKCNTGQFTKIQKSILQFS